MSNIRFVYNHVLKCAGKSFRKNILETHFRGNFCYDQSFKIKYNKVDKKDELQHPIIFEPQKYPLNYRQCDIIFGHFVWSKYHHLKRPKITFIRNPVERLISNYLYYKNGYVNKFGMKDIDILEFANMPLWKNHMTYVLGDIDQYEFIGFVEQYDNSIRKFCNHFGFRQNPSRMKFRINKKKKKMLVEEKINKKIKNKIKNLNKIDMKLYNKAKMKFF